MKGDTEMTTDIQIKMTISNVITEYHQTKDTLEYHCRCAIQTLERAESLGLCSYIAGEFSRLYEKACVSLKKKTWQALISASGVEKVLSVSRMEQFDRLLKNERDIPEPSEEAVLELLSGGTAENLFAEMIREAFDFLRPGAKWHDGYKTNQKNGRNSVGKKVILTYVVQENTFYVEIYPNSRRHLIQVDKIFHLLDGKSFPYEGNYHSPLVDGIGSLRKGETEYFKWERFLNGNLHLLFKRDDLLEKFNQIAAGMIEPALPDETSN